MSSFTGRKVLLTMFLCLLFSVRLLQASEYQLFVSKENQQLVVKKGNEVIKKYYIATGRGERGTKQKQGDNKTPEGIYQISALRKSDRFHYFMQLSYPNLVDAWYGYKHEIITAEEFKGIAKAFKSNQFPPQNTGLGGFIGIHGLGKETDTKLAIHQSLNWTEGCIALTNKEINELMQFVDIGTTVIIE